MGQAEGACEQRGKGAIGCSEKSFGHHQPQCVKHDSGSDEERFHCTHCSTARWLWCSVESNCQALRGDGKRGGEGGEQGLVAVIPKYSLPASLDIFWGRGSCSCNVHRG